jgi:cbb3-type cytochrome oxidase subunit 3
MEGLLMKDFARKAGEVALFVLFLAGVVWLQRAWHEHRRSVAEEMADCMREARGNVDAQVICVYGEDEGD